IILPTSFGATRTSMSVAPRCSTSRMSTLSPSSTSALTIISMTSRIRVQGSSFSLLTRQSGRCLTRGLFSAGAGFDQPADRVSRLRTLLDPVVNSTQIEFDLGGISRWIIGAEVFEIGAVALGLFLFHNHAVRRALLGSGAH